MNQTIITIGIIIFFFLILAYISNILRKKRLQKLNQSRPNLTRTEYINLLVKKGFDKQHAEVVHDEIREFIQMDDFSIYPEDDIRKVYGIEDLDDLKLIDTICEKLNLRKAKQKDLDDLNKDKKSFNAEYILTLIKKLAE